jgi:hypothetical protein
LRSKFFQHWCCNSKSQNRHLDVGQDAALRDGDAGQQLVQLLVVADGQLEVPRDDPGTEEVGNVFGRKMEIPAKTIFALRPVFKPFFAPIKKLSPSPSLENSPLASWTLHLPKK